MDYEARCICTILPTRWREDRQGDALLRKDRQDDKFDTTLMARVGKIDDSFRAAESEHLSAESDLTKALHHHRSRGNVPIMSNKSNLVF